MKFREKNTFLEKWPDYKKSNKIPDAVWLGKLGLYITKNNINYKSSKIAFDEFKPIYVRSPEIN